jgi:hypothetical protein
VPCQRLFPLSHDCVSQLSGWDGKSESPKVRNGYSRVRFYACTLLFLRVNVLGSRGEPILAALDTGDNKLISEKLLVNNHSLERFPSLKA